LDDIGAFLMNLPSRAELPRLYRNNGDGTFADVTKRMRLDRVILPMGANYGDLDNDGWLDCYFGTGTPQFEALLPNKMFRNAEGRTFQDVTTSGGFGHLQKGHAVSFGDLDNDGDEDIFEVIGGALPGDAYKSVLFENPGHKGRWLTLELTGVRENRSAIGARVRVRARTKEGARRDIHRAISAGGSFGASPFRLHVGLGDAVAVDEIEIRWPASGKIQLLRRDLSLDRHYRLREGESELGTVELKRFSLSGKNQAEPHRHH
ncbi:MAG: CRTAC1 family protein, partial [Pyrinomonadaceae bacterium]